MVFQRRRATRAVLARTPRVPCRWPAPYAVPAAKRNVAWDEVAPLGRRAGASRRCGTVSAFVDTNILVRHLTGDPSGHGSPCDRLPGRR